MGCMLARASAVPRHRYHVTRYMLCMSRALLSHLWQAMQSTHSIVDLSEPSICSHHGTCVPFTYWSTPLHGIPAPAWLPLITHTLSSFWITAYIYVLISRSALVNWHHPCLIDCDYSKPLAEERASWWRRSDIPFTAYLGLCAFVRGMHDTWLG